MNPNPILPSPSTTGGPQNYTIGDVGILIANVIAMALAVAGILATIYIVVGAFQYFTAYGDESKAEAGKKTITWALIGLVVIILARVAIGQLFQFFGGFTPGIPTGVIPTP